MVDKYYKCNRNSTTGLKFTEIINREESYEQKAKEFLDKYGFSEYRPGRGSLGYSGVSSCCNPVADVDTKLWKQIGYKEYLPKCNCKAGKAIMKELCDLPEVNINELNNIVNYPGDRFCQTSIGFSYGVGSKEFYGFTVSAKWNIIVPDDCVEITGSEYQSLFNE